MTPSFLAAGLLTIILAAPIRIAASDPGLYNEAGLRMKQYRAPTPAMVPHAQTVDTSRLRALLESERPLLIDVLGVTVRPETAELGAAWLPADERYSLPGAVWLPNVGHGTLDLAMRTYLQTHLQRLTGGDRQRPLVFFCVRDCWMSWNAVQHAHGLGYRNLYWYPGGTDDWRAGGGPLERVDPVPLDFPYQEIRMEY